MTKRLFLTLLCFFSVLAFQSAWTQNGTWVAQGLSNANVIPGGSDVDAKGNIYLTGTFLNTLTLGNITLTSEGETDLYVAKLDSNGNVLWADNYGAWREEYGYDVALDGLGHLYVAGQFRDTTIIDGDSIEPYFRVADIMMLKLDTAGNFIDWNWEGGRGREFCYDIECDDLGNVIMTGVFRTHTIFGLDTIDSRGYNDVFIARMDSNLNWKWGRRIGGKTYDDGVSLTVVDNEKYYITGTISDTAYVVEDSSQWLISNGNTDIFIAAYDSSGGFLWAKSGGGPELDRPSGIGHSGSGNLYVTGRFAGTLDYQGTTVVSNGESDGFLMLTDASGTPTWIKGFGGTGFDAVEGMDVKASGDVAMTGFFYKKMVLPGATLEAWDTLDTDIFFMEYSGGGAFNWASSAGSNSYDTGKDIIYDQHGHAIAQGTFLGTATFGTTSLTSMAGDDSFIARINSQGKVSRDQAAPDPNQNCLAWPNPGNGVFNLRVRHLPNQNPELRLFDLNGQEVLVTANATNGVQETRFQFDLGGLAPGLYLYQVSTATAVHRDKLLLVR